MFYDPMILFELINLSKGMNLDSTNFRLYIIGGISKMSYPAIVKQPCAHTLAHKLINMSLIDDLGLNQNGNQFSISCKNEKVPV